MLSELLSQVADFLLQRLNLLLITTNVVGVDRDLLLIVVDLGDIYVDLLFEVGELRGRAGGTISQLLSQVVEFVL